MDNSDDFRSPQMREKVIKTLENAMKDKPFPPHFRVPNDPRQLEMAIHNGSQTKDDYFKKINKILQMAGSGGQQAQVQHQPQTMGYDMNMGQRMGPGGQMMGAQQHMLDPMQQQGTQQQPAPPNATISTGPLPPQQQQQHYQMGTGAMDGQGRLLPPPNPYGQQQQMGSGMGPQQMTMQPQQQGSMVMNMQGQPSQQQMMQQGPPQHRMMTRQPAPGMRMAQPGPAQAMIIPEGQRYAMPSQDRPGEFMRMPQQQQQRFRTTLPQQSHSMQQPPHWAGGSGSVMTVSSGPQASSTPQQQAISDTVVVTHFGPGMPLRHLQSRDQMSSNPPTMYQTTMQQRPIMAQQQQQQQQPPQPAPPSIAVVQAPPRFDGPPRMPQAMQQQYQRHPAPVAQQLTATTPSVPPTPVMGPPSAPTAPASAGQYVPMQSPNTAPGLGPSPAPAPAAPSLISMPDSSPVYSAGPVSSVGQPRYNVPAEPSPANHPSTDLAVTEDPAYKEKIQELQMYLDPLKRMLEQHQKDGDRSSTQSQKLLKIIDIIEGKSRATLDLLLKCEETLKKMVPKEPAKPTKESALCQPLFDVVASLAKAPNANVTLKRVFDLPSIDISTAKRLCAPKNPNDPMPRTIEAAFAMKMAQLGVETSPEPSTKNGSASDTAKVPVSIQREVASLEPRFRIMFDQGLAASESGKADSLRVIHVVCDLEDQRLPHVPALRLQIPNDYPVNSPKYDYDLMDYCGSPFLNSLREMLITRLTNLGSNCSITSLLDSWESTVRQACLSQ